MGISKTSRYHKQKCPEAKISGVPASAIKQSIVKQVTQNAPGDQYALACYLLQTKAGLSRTEIIGGEELVYYWRDGQLRQTLIRRLGMPVKAFLAYLTLMERVNKEQERQAKRGNSNGKRSRY